MSDKELACQNIRDRPESATSVKISTEIEFTAGTREGEWQADRGKSVPPHVVKEESATCLPT